ncbi:MAG: membrane protein insertion efficiency factor YidD [Bdellovibrionaceae bacterium]|nr:membrane protein insertion efficiency factor YidD [Pseudobdellovibrionaceae bacterium]
MLRFFILFYKAFLSGTLMMGGSCRFYPSCSDYGFLVYKKYPFFKASWLLLKRLFCCNPFGPKFRQEPEIKEFI